MTELNLLSSMLIGSLLTLTAFVLRFATREQNESEGDIEVDQ